jgi:hypothetical protein
MIDHNLGELRPHDNELMNVDAMHENGGSERNRFGISAMQAIPSADAYDGANIGKHGQSKYPIGKTTIAAINAHNLERDDRL